MNVLNTPGTADSVQTAVAETPVPSGPTTPGPASSGKARITVGFITRNSDAVLMLAIARIISGMSGNKAYPSPSPTLATIVATRTAFAAAVYAAQDSKVAKATRRQQRELMESQLRQLAQYVQITCAGDLPTLLSSGFPAQRTREPVGLLVAPARLRLTRGKLSGQLDARCQRLPKAGAYQWRYAAAGAPGVWMMADPTLAASTSLQGLTPGTLYTVQVRAIGASGPSEWSDVAMLMAA